MNTTHNLDESDIKRAIDDYVRKHKSVEKEEQVVVIIRHSSSGRQGQDVTYTAMATVKTRSNNMGRVD